MLFLFFWSIFILVSHLKQHAILSEFIWSYLSYMYRLSIKHSRTCLFSFYLFINHQHQQTCRYVKEPSHFFRKGLCCVKFNNTKCRITINQTFYPCTHPRPLERNQNVLFFSENKFVVNQKE